MADPVDVLWQFVQNITQNVGLAILLLLAVGLVFAYKMGVFNGLFDSNSGR